MTGAWAVFVACVRVGLLGFGGGPSVLPLMQRECVEGGLITESAFLEGLAAGSALPGPIATKMAVWVGWHHAGAGGAVAGLVGMALPSAGLMLGVGALVVRYREQPAVSGALRALQPAVVGLLAYTAWALAPTGIQGVGGAAIAVVAFGLLVADVHPGWVMLAAALWGAFAR